MSFKERILDERTKADKALESGNTTLALVHLYAAAVLAENGPEEPPAESKIELSDGLEKNSGEPEERPLHEYDGTIGSKSAIMVKIRKSSAMMFYQPIRGDDRYRFHIGDGARYELIKKDDTVGGVGHNYSCKLKKNSYYFRSLQVPLFLHHVFGIEKSDPDYSHCSRIVSLAMKHAETEFMKSGVRKEKVIQ